VLIKINSSPLQGEVGGVLVTIPKPPLPLLAKEGIDLLI